jgi:hypothetical protein
MTSVNDVRRVQGARARPAARLLLAVLAVGLTWGCASAQARLERGLLKAGVPPTRSECMARHLASKLSTSQLRRLSKVQQLTPEKLEADGIERFLSNAQALGDPRIVTVTSAVALGCAMVD